MATSRQEKTYNRIIEYYNFADKLIEEVEKSSSELAHEQFEIVEKVVESLEKYADQLTTEYIEYVKGSDKDSAYQKINDALNQILARAQSCKRELIELYDKSNI